MAVWAVSMVKNEADVITGVIENLFGEGIAKIIVADNMSTDGTRACLDSLARHFPITVLQDPSPAYLQSDKMTRLFHMARERGAEWVVPFDGDELWKGVGGRLADVIRTSTDADLLVADVFDHYPVPFLRGSPFAKMPLRQRATNPFCKVAVRALPDVVIDNGNHGASGSPLRQAEGRIVLHHYQYRSFRHFIKKVRSGRQALEAAGAELPDSMGFHWRVLGQRTIPRLAVSWLNRYRLAFTSGITMDLQAPTPAMLFPTQDISRPGHSGMKRA